MTFVAIVCGNLAMILAYRSRELLIVHALRQANPALWIIVGGTLLALGAALYVPALAEVFRFSAPALKDVALAAMAGVMAVGAYELWRFAQRD